MQLNRSTIATILVLLTVVILMVMFLLRPQGEVEFIIAPEEATLTFNGSSRTIRNKETVSFSPGVYTFSIKRTEFSTETVYITVEKDKKIRAIVALNPQTDAAREIIKSNSESVKITQEYEENKRARLFKALPLSGVNYSVEACKSIKYPTTDKKALCITSPTEAGESTAELIIMQLGYDISHYEVLYGPSTLKTLIKTDTYKIQAYQNDPAEHPELYITPINVPYVPPNAPYNEQLESIRLASLARMEAEGYNHDNYVIIFSNIYLSQYNVDVHNHSEEASSSLD